MAMIKKIEIKNFRSIQSESIDLPNFAVLAGLNNSGKTNFLQALRFLRLVSGSGYTVSDASKALNINRFEFFNGECKTNKAIFSVTISDLDDKIIRFSIDLVECDVGDVGQENSTHKEIHVDKEILEQQTEEGTWSVVYTREKGSGMKDMNKNRIPLNVEDDKIALSYFDEPVANKASAIFKKIHAPLPKQITVDSQQSIASEATPSLTGISLRLARTKPDDYKLFQKEISKFLPNFERILHLELSEKENVDPSAVNHYFLLKEKNIASLSLSASSSGDITLLFILTAIFLAEKGSLFIIDEIENGFHPDRLKKLVEWLVMISAKRDIQMLFSTHSSIVLSNVSPQSVILIRKNNLGTKLKKLSDPGSQYALKMMLENGGDINDYINVESQL